MPCLKPLAVAAAFLPTALHAQVNCASRDLVVDKLAVKYGEAFAGGGLQNTKHIFEVWMSEEKGTWTILMTRADGTTCVMASGTNWRGGDPTVKTPAGIPG
jgi:hypothetical protein